MIGYLLGWCCACKQAKASLFLNWAMVGYPWSYVKCVTYIATPTEVRVHGSVAIAGGNI